MCVQTKSGKHVIQSNSRKQTRLRTIYLPTDNYDFLQSKLNALETQLEDLVTK